MRYHDILYALIVFYDENNFIVFNIKIIFTYVAWKKHLIPFALGKKTAKSVFRLQSQEGNLSKK